MSEIFSYTITGVPDFDQRWKSLPNEGACYCLPTSAMNWLQYLAKHADWNARLMTEIKNDDDASAIVNNLIWMGGYMNTNPMKGTRTDDAYDGLVDYMEDFFLIPAVVSIGSIGDDRHITLADLAALAMMKALIVIDKGRYDKFGDQFFRKGGHAMSLVGMKWPLEGLEADLEVRDPGDDRTDLNSQSGRKRTPQHVTQLLRNVEGDICTVLQWGTKDGEFVDHWRALIPPFALTNPTAGVLFLHTASFETKAIETKTIPLPFEGELADLALHPALPRASMIARGSNEIRTLDVPRGSWSTIRAQGAPQRLTYGGRDRRLFVVDGKTIQAFDAGGKVLGRLDAAIPIDAISYDSKNNRLLAASSSAKTLLAVAPSLEVAGHTELPEVRGKGRLSLSVNGRDATIVVSREGSTDAATLRWHATGAMASGRFRLMADGRTSSTHVNSKGRVFAVEEGKIATFDSDGDRIAGSVFDGLPAGPLLKIARSNSNIDPVRAQKKEWMDA